MANLDPWSYAEKTRSEHAEQVALFMWANMAKLYGPVIAADPNSYNKTGFAKYQFEHAGELGCKLFAPPISQLKWLHAISNHGAGFGRKAEGVKKGVADIFLPVPVGPYWRQDYNGNPVGHCGLYIELKRLASAGKKEGLPSSEQLEFQEDMRKAGYQHEIIYGWMLARDCILRYLNIS